MSEPKICVVSGDSQVQLCQQRAAPQRGLGLRPPAPRSGRETQLGCFHSCRQRTAAFLFRSKRADRPEVPFVLPPYLNLCRLKKNVYVADLPNLAPQKVGTVQSKRLVLPMYYNPDTLFWGGCFLLLQFNFYTLFFLTPPTPWGSSHSPESFPLYCFKLAGVAPERHSITMETIPPLSHWPLVNKEVRAADWCLPLLKVVTASVVTTPCQKRQKNTHLHSSPNTGSTSTPQPFITHFYRGICITKLRAARFFSPHTLLSILR